MQRLRQKKTTWKYAAFSDQRLLPDIEVMDFLGFSKSRPVGRRSSANLVLCETFNYDTTKNSGQ